MPKFSQTLVANTYNETDIATTMKTGFDNLGWGTGKVDILGGYRYTTTDATNSVTTPLSLLGSNFIDNMDGKNIARPHADYYANGASILAMYLPGVKSLRIKYTIVSDIIADGTSVLWDDSKCMMGLYYYSARPDKPDTFTTETIKLEKLITSGTNQLVGTQYTTAWSTGSITCNPSICIKLASANWAVRVDAIEWQVSANKFAFSSPNLDSPTFEINSTSYLGNYYTTMSAYPIKDSKTAFAKMSRVNSLSNSTSPIEQLVMYHYSNLLFNLTLDPMSIGFSSSVINVEVLGYGSYGKDMIVRMGSNNTYDGFYLNTKQDSATYQGTVWDSVDKSSGITNSTPQYPAARITTSGTQSNTISSAYANYIGDYITTYPSKQGFILKVSSPTYVSALVAQLTTYSYYMSSANVTVGMALLKTSRRVDGRFDVTEVIAPYRVDTYPYNSPAYNYYSGKLSTKINLNIEKTLQAGYYIFYVYTSNVKAVDSPFNYTYDAKMDGSGSSTVQWLGNVTSGQSPVATTVLNGIRYIRDSLKGSSSNISNHWVEIQALAGTTNVAQGKTVTSSSAVSKGSLAYVVDGDYSNSDIYAELAGNGEYQYIQVDLGSVRTDLTKLKIWHYYTDNRKYNSKLEVSEDGVNWVKLYEGAYVETNYGMEHKVDSFPWSPRLNDISNSLEIGGIIGSGNLIDARNDNLLNPILSAVVVQTASATPVNTIGGYAENWFSYGKRGVANNSPYLERVTKGYVSAYAGGVSIPSARFNFGFDRQLLNFNRNESMASWSPGGNYNYHVNRYLANKDAKQLIEFGPSATPVFSTNNYPYRKAWLCSYEGINVKVKNTYLVNGVVSDLNVSYVTNDGSEFVTCFASFDYPTGSSFLTFRLK